MLPALDREGWQAEGLTGWVVIQRRSRRISVVAYLPKSIRDKSPKPVHDKPEGMSGIGVTPVEVRFLLAKK